MSKKLVIVESPTKARTISRFLGSDFDVTSSMGHIRDLPKSKLGVDEKKNFLPTYEIPVRAKKTVAELKKKTKSSSEVILATDEDREGEAIAWHLMKALDLKSKNTKRIVFHEITKSAIQEALKSPRELDMNLVDAQQARRILDRLVGYKLSPFLWKKIMRGLSAGRVQSVTVRLIVEREKEINKFKPQEYWQIIARLKPEKNSGVEFEAALSSIDGKTLKKLDIKSGEEAKKILTELDNATYHVSNVEKREVKRNPAAPFTTSTLQQECARRFGYSAKQTMMLAQQLYEGFEVGEDGHTGLITYMRTDSVNLAEQALGQINAEVKNLYGQEYALSEPRRYKTKSKGAQEAHEAIRPTDVSRRPENIEKYLDPKQYRVYDLIWKRTLASQMKEALFDQTTILIYAETKSTPTYVFKATGRVIKFEGFIKVYEEGKDDNGKEEDLTGRLPELIKDESLKLLELKPNQSFTEPPPRFNDATLIKALEEHGIGRPSTYAPIITTILTRKYVEKKEKRFYPTEIGIAVNKMLSEHFPKIVDIKFTAKMEELLDGVAEGKTKWQPVIEEFYTPFKKNLKEKTDSVDRVVEKTDIKCKTCGKPMVVKYGRFGKFLNCSDYPNCKTTDQLPEEKVKEDELKEKTKGELCPICGKEMNVRRGRFGYFLGCPDYPACKGISKIWNKTGFKCPNCRAKRDAEPSRDTPLGDIAEKKSRGRGKPFYACTRYPECEFLMNTRPQNENELNKAYETWKNKPEKKQRSAQKNLPHSVRRRRTTTGAGK
ncbi:MAG: type I DNA topoisomerase [Candidatus Doudnabacteria bacterium CG10_big_fil_rev_8_21_14_0_10_41_10]|uniref:DNA topoisomerase 1 n=1 Tax=Candidatus Doudnabacteria bacterium CG10_big_fil_rev_8_21_14_0_10_41_10 TaxID=1974551 RepID=A0A2H0VCX3_9BACT|nr:MAG: type I DNA topoisomerase [Candidatus Doudnabacteria bacterium CG10_big_fil_rev_8_21_14_0_10_41_10]